MRLKKRQLPMTQRIIYIPLIAIAIGLWILVNLASVTTRDSLIAQMQKHTLGLSEQMATRVADHQRAMKTINGLLEDKIALIGLAASEGHTSFDGNSLRALAQRFGVGETNWFDQRGTILASTVERYRGWVAPMDHPVRTFMDMPLQVWSEQIRKDSESNRYNKYGYYRLVDGTFLQIALPADDVQRLTDQFTEAHLVKQLAALEDVLGVAYYGDNLDVLANAYSNQTIATSQTQLMPLPFAFTDDQKSKLKLGQSFSLTLKGDRKEALHIFIPLLDKGVFVGAMHIAYNLDGVYKSIEATGNRIALIGGITLVLTAVLMELLLRHYVAKPIKDLSEDMGKIHLETDSTYRLPERESDPFVQLRQTTNHVLNITHQYFEEIITHQEELIASNEELEATIGQLCASEEELRAQYDEIEAYAHHLASLQRRYAIAIEATSCFVWEYNYSTGLIHIADPLVVRIGSTTDQLRLEDFVAQYVHPEDRGLVTERLTHLTIPLLVDLEALQMHMRLKNADGAWSWYLIRGSAIEDVASATPQLVGVMVDVHLQKEQELYIQYLAEHDPLTGLYSRRKFHEHVGKAIEANQSGTVLLMDIDNFKYINDYYGHVYGDKVLKHFAGLLKTHLLEHSQIYRLGGDEFLLHVRADKTLDQVLERLDSFVDQLRQDQQIEGLNQRITVSVGIAQYPQHADRVDDLLMKADMAMYYVKKSGKNHISCYNEGLQMALSHRLNVESHLRKQLEEGGFELHYQPIIAADKDAVASFEALIRLKDRLYTPSEFIPIAEETGLIYDLGLWVIEAVISQQKTWQNSGYKICPVAINLSPRQMGDLQLVDKLKHLLGRYDLDPSHIEIEITESILVENREENLQTLKALRDLGISIALDDFGTGYSSLNYLTFIPVDKIKLDKSLKDKFIDLETIQVMDSLISLAHGLQLKVVAEGVETEMERGRLKAGKCDYLQGYFFSKPLPAHKAILWLDKACELDATCIV